jgi:hypothetical protein
MKQLIVPLLLGATLLTPACSSKEDGDGETKKSNSSNNDDDSSDDSSAENAGEIPSNGVIDAPEQEIDEDDVLEGAGDTDVHGGSFGVITGDCEGISQTPEQLRSPVDIIFVVDNSSSMAGEIEQIQERINEDFARIIEDSGVDYRVIMIARYGDVNTAIGESDHPICIRAPLGAGNCFDPNNEPLEQNPPRFFHYSADVRSREPWCDILDGWDSPDELTLNDTMDRAWESSTPIGWREFLREEAFKEFVVISDDNSDCERDGRSFHDQRSGSGGRTAAVAFDTALLELSPRQFGSNVARRYKFHSIVGLRENENSTEAWPASAPLQTDTCNPGSEGPGTGFQALSILTGGLRYPTCNNDNFNAIFNELAEGVVTGSLACEWAIPTSKDFDAAQVNMNWTSAGVTQVIGHVDTAKDCEEADGWYYDDNDDPATVIACPATCDLLQTDPNGRVDLLFGCDTVPAPPRVR